MIHKIRTQQIVMDLPTEGADVWIRAALQLVIKDDNYKTIQTVDRFGVLHREMSRVLGDTVTVINPFTGEILTLNVATVGLAVTELIKTWIAQKYPDFHNNEHGDLVKEL